MTGIRRLMLAACLGAGAVVVDCGEGWGMSETERGAGSEIRYRTATIDRDALATRKAGDDAIPISISSEEPVERAFGREILSHDPAAVDLSRASDGLPFLDNHETGRQLGLIEDVRIGADRRLRGRIRFGNHPDAAWMRKDIEAGIRRNISVGYRVDATEPTGRDEYRVTRWTPMEVSTVPVPADATVGVGRSAGGPRPSDHGLGGEGRMATALEFRRDIEGIYRLAAEHGLTPDVAANAVERGLSRDQFAAEVLERKQAQHGATRAVGVDLSEKEHRRYNVSRAILAQATGDWRGAGLEREVSEHLARSKDGYQGGVMVPWNTRASITGNVAGTSSLGGAAVATEIRELIDLLRNRLTVAQAGALFLPGLQGNISYPRQITPTTLNWVGENPSSANTLSNMTFDNVNLSPKTAMVSTAYSRQFLVQGAFDVSAVVANDLAQVCAVGLDYAALNGLGSSNQPTGIRVQSGIGVKTLGSNGGNLAWADILDFEKTISTANADIGSISFLFTPGTRSKLKSTLQNTTSGAAYIFGADDRVNGYRAFVTNQLPSNLTTGTSTTICHAAIFGVFPELLVGLWGPGVEILIDPYSVAGQNMIACHAFLMADIGLRHPAAMMKCDQVLVT